MDRKEAMERMIGPVPSISIPFTQDGEVDYRGLADFVEFLVANKTCTNMDMKSKFDPCGKKNIP